MSFSDFLRRDSAPPTVSQPPSQQQTASTRVEQLPAEVKAQAVEAAHPAAKLMEQATQHTQTPSDNSAKSDGKEALIRNQGGQGKEQSALSPTDHSKSETQVRATAPARGRGMER